jgi:hypothetical protein
MSARVLARITPEEPWGETRQPLDVVAAERPPVFCSYCHEAITHDGEMWRHVRTGLSADWRSKECHPLCRECGAPATRAIGGEMFVGSGIRFVVDHFVCTGCVSKSGAGIIEHIS